MLDHVPLSRNNITAGHKIMFVLHFNAFKKKIINFWHFMQHCSLEVLVGVHYLKTLLVEIIAVTMFEINVKNLIWLFFFAGSQPGGLTNLDRKIFSCDICDWSTITYFLPTPSINSVWDRAPWSWTNPIWNGTLYYKYWAVVQRVLALWSRTYWTSPICTYLRSAYL